METIGQKLKAAREQKGLSQEEVARAIKIKVCYVAAIEKDQFQNLIAPVYAKGFIKLYAKAVGLDPTPLARQFSGLDIFTDEIVGKREEMTPPPVAAPAAVPSVAPRKRRSRPLFAGLTDSIRKIRLSGSEFAEGAGHQKACPAVKGMGGYTGRGGIGPVGAAIPDTFSDNPCGGSENPAAAGVPPPGRPARTLPGSCA